MIRDSVAFAGFFTADIALTRSIKLAADLLGAAMAIRAGGRAKR